jgi:hypothetical protein
MKHTANNSLQVDMQTEQCRDVQWRPAVARGLPLGKASAKIHPAVRGDDIRTSAERHRSGAAPL